MLKALNVNRLGWIVSILLAILVLFPLAAVIVQVLLPGVFFGELNFGDLSLLLDVFNRPLWRKSLENSLLLGIGTTLFGTILGTVLAMARSRWSFRGLRCWMLPPGSCSSCLPLSWPRAGLCSLPATGWQRPCSAGNG